MTTHRDVHKTHTMEWRPDTGNWIKWIRGSELGEWKFTTPTVDFKKSLELLHTQDDA